MGRNSIIELLRILAMFAIVCGHVVAALPVDVLSGFNLYGACLLGSGLRIAVNVFVMIGAWFLVDATFRFDRVFRLYLAIVCYSVLSLVLAYAVGNGLAPLDIVRHLFPFMGANFWFVTVYIALLLLAPILNIFFRLSQRAQAASLVFAGAFCVFYASCPYPRHGSMERFLGWFVYLYLLIGFLKHAMAKRMYVLRGALLGVSASVYLVLALFRCGHGPLARLACQYTYDVISFPNFLCALTLFLGFVGFSPRENKIVNALARPMLGVYLAHGVLAGLYSAPVCGLLQSKKESPFFCGMLVLCAAIVFLLSEMVDVIRIRLVEVPFRRSGIYQAICKKVESFYRESL